MILVAGSEDDVIGMLAATMAATPTGFDANYTRAAVSLGMGDNRAQVTLPTAQGEFWLHVRCGYASGSQPANWQAVLFKDATGNAIARVRSNSRNAILERATAVNTFVAVGATFGTPNFTLDIQVKQHASAGRIALYLNGALWAEFTGNTVVSGIGACKTIIFGGWDQGVGANAYIGEVIVTTGDEPTVGYRLVTAAPSAAGTDSGWTGAVTDVNEVSKNAATFLSASTAGLTSTFALPVIAAAVAATGQVIRAVVTSWEVKVGTTGPQALYHILQTGGVNAQSAAVAVSTTLGATQVVWDVDPNTAAALTVAGFNGAQLGVRSAV